MVIALKIAQDVDEDDIARVRPLLITLPLPSGLWESAGDYQAHEPQVVVRPSGRVSSASIIEPTPFACHVHLRLLTRTWFEVRNFSPPQAETLTCYVVPGIGSEN